MKPTDNLAPYILASMHPIMHMSLLFTSFIMIAHDREKFYEIPGTCDDKDANKFATTEKYHLMFIMMTAHLICIAIHYLYQVLNHYNQKTFANILLVLKVLVYIYAVMEVQTGITFENCTDITDNSVVMAWLTYEVIAFYFNILSVVFFLFIASFKKFRTIRDRLNYGGKERKQ